MQKFTKKLHLKSPKISEKKAFSHAHPKNFLLIYIIYRRILLNVIACVDMRGC